MGITLIICSTVVVLFLLIYKFFYAPTYTEEIIREMPTYGLKSNGQTTELPISVEVWVKQTYSNGKEKIIKRKM